MSKIPKSLRDDILLCFKKIYAELQRNKNGYVGKSNSSGDRQVKLDLVSNRIMIGILGKNDYVSFLASEELDIPIENHQVMKQSDSSGRDCFSVVFDPLDGSSVSDCNMTVGTIVGVYKGTGVTGKRGKDQVAVFMSVYGQKLQVYQASDAGLLLYDFDEVKNRFRLVKRNIVLSKQSRYFSPGNLNVCSENKTFKKILEYWLENNFKLRYSGSMAADVNHIFKKESGIFLYPGSKKNPEGKLRLLYECAPVAYLVQKAGGFSIDGKQDILDIPVDSIHQKSPFFSGSINEVKMVSGKLGNHIK